MKRLSLNFIIFMTILGAMLEVSARIDDKLTYNAPLFRKYHPDAQREEDSSGIRYNIPNTRYQKWEINSLGFRGKEIDLEKKEGQIRIVCFGESETFGYFESKDKEWPSQLGEMLRDKFPRVEVINVSVAGLNPKKRKDYIEKYVLPLKPDIMIIFQGFIEYIKNPRKEGERKDLVNKGKEKKGKNLIKVLLSHSRVLPKLEETKNRSIPKWLFTNISLWRLRRQVKTLEKKYLISKEPVDEVPENIILEMERDFRSFVHYLKENSIVPVLSTYPTLLTPFNKDRYKDVLLAGRRFAIELSEDGIIDAPRKFNQVVRRIAEEQNLTFIDNDHLMPKTQEYFGDNSHYTNKGAEFIAKNFYYILDHCKLIE